MKVRYIYSACIEIETPDIRILTDPWFKEGIYDGSWYHYPEVKNPLDIIREPDYIYISHIHPDHYDPDFLREAFKKWGPKPVLIPDFPRNYLEFKMAADGIEPTPIKELKVENTHLHIVPNITGSSADIDSALFVNHGDKNVLNLNDCIWNDEHVIQLQSTIKKYTDELDMLALGYTGAGTFPQTYFDIEKDKEILLQKGHEKKHSFFKRYGRYCEAFPAKTHLPFAGKYLLGGKLSHMNFYRGVSDPVEVTEFDDKAVILADLGKGEIDLNTYETTELRTEVYKTEDIEKRIEEIKNLPMDYERDILIPEENLNFNRMIRVAYERAHSRSEVEEDYWFVINVGDNKESRFMFNVNKNKAQFERLAPDTDNLPEPRSELTIDYRYLFGLLTNVYHWNNAAVGSMYYTRRYPVDNFNRKAMAFLNFFNCF